MDLQKFSNLKISENFLRFAVEANPKKCSMNSLKKKICRQTIFHYLQAKSDKADVWVPHQLTEEHVDRRYASFFSRFDEIFYDNLICKSQ